MASAGFYIDEDMKNKLDSIKSKHKLSTPNFLNVAIGILNELPKKLSAKFEEVGYFEAVMIFRQNRDKENKPFYCANGLSLFENPKLKHQMQIHVLDGKIVNKVSLKLTYRYFEDGNSVINEMRVPLRGVTDSVLEVLKLRRNNE